MSIIERNKVDFVSIREKSNEIVLTISDHLDWSDPDFHIQMLEDKINGYIEFIEGGQIKTDYPDSILYERIKIEIISQFEYPIAGINYLEKVKPVLLGIGIELVQTLYEE